MSVNFDDLQGSCYIKGFEIKILHGVWNRWFNIWVKSGYVKACFFELF
jgi:hypothetical protein